MRLFSRASLAVALVLFTSVIWAGDFNRRTHSY